MPESVLNWAWPGNRTWPKRREFVRLDLLTRPWLNRRHGQYSTVRSIEDASLIQRFHWALCARTLQGEFKHLDHRKGQSLLFFPLRHELMISWWCGTSMVYTGTGLLVNSICMLVFDRLPKLNHSPALSNYLDSLIKVICICDKADNITIQENSGSDLFNHSISFSHTSVGSGTRVRLLCCWSAHQPTFYGHHCRRGAALFAERPLQVSVP